MPLPLGPTTATFSPDTTLLTHRKGREKTSEQSIASEEKYCTCNELGRCCLPAHASTLVLISPEGQALEELLVSIVRLGHIVGDEQH